MKWLIWKEYRLNRLILMVGAILLLLPHAVALLLTWYEAGPAIRGGPPQLCAYLPASVVYSVVLSQLTLALLGGNAIACERADRSAEFLAYLPISRGRILAGKIAVPVVSAALVWGLNLLVLLLVLAKMPEPPLVGPSEQLWKALGYVAITGLTFFSVGWLLSSLLESPTFAICGGLITPFLIVMGTLTWAWLAGHPDEAIGPPYRHICIALSCVSLLAGTWYYVRRVEP